MICGDLNQFGISNCHRESPDIVEINTPPTRKDKRLDLVSCNFAQYVTNTVAIGPLESLSCPSDHKVLLISFDIPHIHRFKILTYQARKQTKKSEEQFVSDVNKIDWTHMADIKNATTLTEIFQSQITKLVNIHFPLIMRKVKSSDDPWITDYVRSLIKLRAKEYIENGRSPRFKWLDAEIKAEIALQKKIWFNKECVDTYYAWSS